MESERFGLLKFKGSSVTIVGNDLKPGDKAPEFKAHSLDWAVFQGLEQTKGKVRIIAAVPSLDTEVCDRETRRFNIEASNLGDDIVILVISTDLPFAQKRWCGGAGVDRVMTLSDHSNGEFGKNYGCFIKEVGLLRRAVFVIDRKNIITYSDYMPTLGDEPNYDAVLDAAKAAL
jgi:thiol peroxidase